MAEPLANKTYVISDTSARTLIELLLTMGACARTSAPQASAAALSNLSNADAGIREWHDSMSLAEQTRLAAELPEILARQAASLKTDDDFLTRCLLETAIASAKLRSVEHNVAQHLEARHRQSIYNFAYGLSHEFNNPLANISTRAGVLAQREQDPAKKQLLQAVIDSAMRGCEMLGDLMLVARPAELEVRPVSAHDFLAPLVQKAQHWTVSHRVAISSEIFCERPLSIDLNAMSEALWCLIRNAIEANSKHVRVLLRTATHESNGVEIEVQDDGAGLSETALQACFDPYFCGRESGRGLGLGLTKALRIVQQHGGSLKLTNLPTGGCTATVRLPC